MQPLSDSQREALAEAVTAYQNSATAEAASYLGARGISPDAADTARLGVVGDPFPGHERFAGYLSIPYLDQNSEPLSIRFRRLPWLPGEGPKYMSISGEPVRVYNVGAIHRADEVVHIAEGELDAIVLEQLGMHAVAIPGAQLWRGHHRRMLAGFRRIYVWGDGDDAGADFTRKVTQSLRRAKGVRVPRGMDVTDIYLAGGAQALLSLIAEEDQPE